MAKPRHPERNGAPQSLDVPEGWALAPLSKLLALMESGGRPKGGVRHISEGVPSIGGEHLDSNGGFRLERVKFVPDSFYKTMRHGHIAIGDVLIVKDGATTGKVALVREDFPYKKAVVNEHVFICRPAAPLRADFLFWFLFSQQGQNEILSNFQGSAQGGINQTFAANTFIPVAPLPEQKRIVAKIDALTAHVDAARERLAKVPAILKRFRQSVLAAACSGRLTGDWRELHPDIDPASQLLKNISVDCRRKTESQLEDDLPELPETWAWSRFAILIGELRNGISTKPNIDPPGTKILRINSVRPGAVIFDDVRFLPDSEHLLSTYRLREGDLLFTRYNGSLDLLGVCGMVRHLPKEPVLYPDKLMRVRFDHAYVVPAYVEIFFQSRHARDRLTARSKSSAGQQGVSGADIKAQFVALPPVEEQREIVRRVEALFKVADAIEKRVAMATARAEKLTQSILAEAFRGELVPTEADLARREGLEYESACDLLTRIRSDGASKTVRKEERKGRAPDALLS